MTEEHRAAKIAELITHLPEQVSPPSRAEIQAFHKTDEFDDAVRAGRAREAVNALCTRKPTTVVIGEPDLTGWTRSMLQLYAACQCARTPFTLKDGRERTMYLADDDALERTLTSARKFPRTFKRTFVGDDIHVTYVDATITTEMN
jgi:hypothetical protein